MPQGRGFVFILSAPSGAGKSTLAAYLTNHVPGVRASVSTTTRPPRPGEVEGVHYHFVTPESFLAQVAQGVFLEYAEVFGNYYGTSREMVAAALELGEILLLTIDWQGAAQVVQAMDPADTVSIFLLPPDREVLRRRLEGRGQDLPEIIARRMAQADAEMTHWREYDYIVINDDLNEAQEGVRGIVLAERQRRERLNSRGIAILQGFNVWDSPSG